MDIIPVVIFWILAVVGLFGPRPFLIYLFFACMSFGSFAVVPPGLTGGLTFAPTPMVALLIIVRTFFDRRTTNYVLRMLLAPKGLLLLFLFWIVCVITTVMMPHLFAGQVEIISLRGVVSRPDLLVPSTQNISQLAYLTISVFAVVAFAKIFRDPTMVQHAMRAICLGAGVAIFTGMLDFASQYVSLNAFLAPFRTATYSLMTDNEILNSKRVVGLMPEASAYGGVCTGFLSCVYFFRRAVTDRILRERITPILIIGLLVFTWLSTSSAAYIALIIFIITAVSEWIWRSLFVKRGDMLRQHLAAEFTVACCTFLAIAVILFFKPSLFDPIISMFDRMVLQKAHSDSFEERSTWSSVSLHALVSTYGLGVGLGGTRASNAFVAVISSTGVLGGILFYSFVIQNLIRRTRPGDATARAILNAVRWSLIPNFVTGLLIGTTADIGALGAFRYGLATAVAFTLVTGASRWQGPLPSASQNGSSPEEHIPTKARHNARA